MQMQCVAVPMLAHHTGAPKGRATVHRAHSFRVVCAVAVCAVCRARDEL